MKPFTTKFVPLFFILLLFSLILSACGGASLGVENPTLIPPLGGTPEGKGVQGEGSPTSGVGGMRVSPTTVLEGTSVQVQDTAAPESTVPSYDGWQQYTNTDYGFAFYYPAGWILEEFAEKDMGEGLTMMGASVQLQKEGNLLFIGYKKADEERIFWTGMPAGDFEPRNPLTFLGQPMQKNALVLEGKVKNVSYAFTTVADLTFAIRLDDRGGLDYMDVDFPLDLQQEVDQILTSFSIIP